MGKRGGKREIERDECTKGCLHIPIPTHATMSTTGLNTSVLMLVSSFFRDKKRETDGGNREREREIQKQREEEVRLESKTKRDLAR